MKPLRSAILSGTVMHRRLTPFSHGFRYRLSMYRLDLDELAQLNGRLRLFGVDRARLRSQADELSGGNQQKLAFGRAIGGDEPGVLLMNEPTRGVDVGARADIYRLIRQFCDRGYCLVMASSDIEEVLGIADVIVSMYRGRQIATYTRGAADMHRVLTDITHPVGTA